MFTKDEMRNNINTIREFVSAYRPDLTVLGAVIGEQYGLFDDINDYIEVMNEVSIEEFIGNYFGSTCIAGACEQYRAILNKEVKFSDWIESLYGNDVKQRYLSIVK